MTEKLSFLTALKRGFSRRCPFCGLGALFVSGTQVVDRCSSCDQKILEDQGDPWAFLLFLDRALFIFPLVAALFLGWHRAHFPSFLGFCVVLGVGFVIITQRRYGVCVGVVCWVRKSGSSAR